MMRNTLPPLASNDLFGAAIKKSGDAIVTIVSGVVARAERADDDLGVSPGFQELRDHRSIAAACRRHQRCDPIVRTIGIGTALEECGDEQQVPRVNREIKHGTITADLRVHVCARLDERQSHKVLTGSDPPAESAPAKRGKTLLVDGVWINAVTEEISDTLEVPVVSRGVESESIWRVSVCHDFAAQRHRTFELTGATDTTRKGIQRFGI